MIQLIGLKNSADTEIRGKFAILSKNMETALKGLLELFEEAVIISTCNRTEVYINTIYNESETTAMVFDKLGWDSQFIKYTFNVIDKDAVRHLVELACGFHSKILGEDQILGQVKTAYETALSIKGVKHELQRLFQTAITCGKEFKAKCEIYKIPVSSSSIVVKESLSRGIRRFMLVGFGEVGELTARYLLNNDIDVLYICVREPEKIIDNELIKGDRRVRVITFEERSSLYGEVSCVISCTSAPHPVIRKKDIGDSRLLIFDLAVPRDVEQEVMELENAEVYDIDKISIIDKENKAKRKEKMDSSRYIVDKYINQFEEWRSLRELAPYIEKLKRSSELVSGKRYNTFKNKRHTKDNEYLAKVLLKSTSDAYINRAIEVLKEEKLEGRAEECLRLIEKIFYNQN